MSDQVIDGGRVPIIRCVCGHTVLWHEQHSFGACDHPQCACETWEMDPDASDAEYVEGH